jgi:hypothetical protein
MRAADGTLTALKATMLGEEWLVEEWLMEEWPMGERWMPVNRWI